MEKVLLFLCEIVNMAMLDENVRRFLRFLYDQQILTPSGMSHAEIFERLNLSNENGILIVNFCKENGWLDDALDMSFLTCNGFYELVRMFKDDTELSRFENIAREILHRINNSEQPDTYEDIPFRIRQCIINRLRELNYIDDSNRVTLRGQSAINDQSNIF